MKVVIAHGKTQDEAIVAVDKSANDLFDLGGGSVSLTDQKKTWAGPLMDFSLVARVGFIALPISGTVEVDEVNVTVEAELPSLVKTFVGADKIRLGVERKVRGMLQGG